MPDTLARVCSNLQKPFSLDVTDVKGRQVRTTIEIPLLADIFYCPCCGKPVNVVEVIVRKNARSKLKNAVALQVMCTNSMCTKSYKVPSILCHTKKKKRKRPKKRVETQADRRLADAAD
jgi:hypothetical protein